MSLMSQRLCFRRISSADNQLRVLHSAWVITPKVRTCRIPARLISFSVYRAWWPFAMLCRRKGSGTHPGQFWSVRTRGRQPYFCVAPPFAKAHRRFPKYKLLTATITGEHSQAILRSRGELKSALAGRSLGPFGHPQGGPW